MSDDSQTLRQLKNAGSDTSQCSMLREVRLDNLTVGQEYLNIENKLRSNLFPWNGQFSPQLVHTLLEVYAGKGYSVLDSFMGSGTVPVEAGRLGLSAFGADINPAACQMAQTYRFINVDPTYRTAIVHQADHLLRAGFDSSPLFSNGVDLEENVKTRLLTLWRSASNAQLRMLLGTLIVRVDFHKNGLTAAAVLASWDKLRRNVLSLPNSENRIELANCDARQLPLEASTKDLVISSPPYINVFNYHQQYRASAEAMGWDLLHVARSEVGSNRKHRQNRFLTVIQYCLDMVEAIRELQRVCKPSARIILVVGRESNVLKTKFYNGDIVTGLGTRCVGLRAEKRQERVFRSKFGTMIYEDIIHFRPSSGDANGDSPRVIAEEALRAALTYSPQESVEYLKDALDRIGEIEASPMYEPRHSGAKHNYETTDAALRETESHA